ncbi:MAG: hypothetical protein GTN76_05640, partial [Candidatus Aenigmarchaeota archaeon]|nr:hypothetical protein [Candidatus Aenigmarchaeota archaeon]
RERRYGPRTNLKDKTQFGREATYEGEDKAPPQNSKVKHNDLKTSGVSSNTTGSGSKTTDVRIKKTEREGRK